MVIFSLPFHFSSNVQLTKKCLLYLFRFLVSILLIYNRIMFWLNMFIQHKLWAEEQRTFLATKWFLRNDSMHTLFVPFQNKWVANFFSSSLTLDLFERAFSHRGKFLNLKDLLFDLSSSSWFWSHLVLTIFMMWLD